MAKGAYIGVGSKARKIKKIYFGVGGYARKVKKAYIGIGGKAQLWYTSTPTLKKLSNINAFMTSTHYVDKTDIPSWGPNFAAYAYGYEEIGKYVTFINSSLATTREITGMTNISSQSGGRLGNYALFLSGEEYDDDDEISYPYGGGFAFNSSYTESKISSVGYHYNSSFANIANYALCVGGARTAGTGSGSAYKTVDWIDTSLTRGKLDDISGSNEIGARSGRGNTSYAMFFKAGGTTLAYDSSLTKFTVGAQDTSLVYDCTAGNDNWVIEHRGYYNGYNKTVAFDNNLVAHNLGGSILPTRYGDPYGGNETPISSSTVSIYPGGAIETTSSGTVNTQYLWSIRLIDEELTMSYASENLTIDGGTATSTKSINSTKIGEDLFLFPLETTNNAGSDVKNINVYKLDA